LAQGRDRAELFVEIRLIFRTHVTPDLEARLRRLVREDERVCGERRINLGDLFRCTLHWADVLHIGLYNRSDLWLIVEVDPELGGVLVLRTLRDQHVVCCVHAALIRDDELKLGLLRLDDSYVA